MPEILNEKELAQMLGIPYFTLRTRRRSGEELPPSFTIGKHRRYRKCDVEYVDVVDSVPSCFATARRVPGA